MIRLQEPVIVVLVGLATTVAYAFAQLMNMARIAQNPANVKCNIRNYVIRRMVNVCVKLAGVAHYVIGLVPS